MKIDEPNMALGLLGEIGCIHNVTKTLGWMCRVFGSPIFYNKNIAYNNQAELHVVSSSFNNFYNQIMIPCFGFIDSPSFYL